VAVGDESAPDWEDLDMHKEVKHGVFKDKFEVTPRWENVNCYDILIKVKARENQVKLFHQAFCKWYMKVQEAYAQATIYPWVEKYAKKKT